MPKLYIFGIGGTGSRTIKSLSMLLASGVTTNYDIVPIIIDPDQSAADVNRTVKILNNYSNIQEKVKSSSKNTFFKNKIKSLGEIINEKHGNVLNNSYVMGLDGIDSERFGDFIDYSTLEDENKSLTELLFSESNLELNLKVGFKGNPNIGSIVLNSFVKSKEFQHFADSFTDGDKIFIISSIFGGTGAAGFPLLLKNLREAKVNDVHNQALRNAVIGAITVKPYFKLDSNPDSEIDSHSFNAKAIAALHYYQKNISNNNSLNALYYIGDTGTAKYTNSEGGITQKNDAHFIELASALSIIDFANDDTLLTSDGKALNTKQKEFGIKNKISDVITFPDLHETTQFQIKENLTKLFYFNLFCKDALKDSLDAPFAKSGDFLIDQNFLNQTFYINLSDFMKDFRIWLGELNRNVISFAPFNINYVTEKETVDVIDISYDKSDIYNLINNIEPKKGGFFGKLLASKNYDFYVQKLNEVDKVNGGKYKTAENKFLEIFSEATKVLINEKLF